VARKKIPSVPKKFLEELKEEFQPVIKKILTHPFVDGVEKGEAPDYKLRFFVKQQFHIVSGDFRNLALYIAFSPNRRIRDFFFELIQGERSALDNLFKMAEALGVSTKELEDSEPHPGSLAFTSYFTRLAAYGTAAETACAIILDFEVWGENCSRLSIGLKKHYNLTAQDTKFLDGFYPVTPQFYDNIINIIGEYVGTAENRKKMRIAARLGLDYELMFWDTMEGHKE
jgi:thiaminase/transcriptional activator TenA